MAVEGKDMVTCMSHLWSDTYVNFTFQFEDASSVRQLSTQVQVRVCVFIANPIFILLLPTQGGVKYLYVNTDTSIYRLPVQRCSRFLSCR